MGNIHTVFEAILDNGTSGKKVRLGVANKLDYETARTRLVKLWNQHKDLLISIAGEDCDPLLAYSLCADYDEHAACGTFFLGKPRRKPARSYSFSIVGNEPEPTPELPDAVNDETISTSKLAE